MKDLTSSRGWEYAFQKLLESEIEIMRDTLENGENRELSQFVYLCGQIRGIRVAIKDLSEVRERFNVDDDKDLVG